MQVVYPGAYRCVCVQIKLHHMAVNATVQAGVVGELEGAALLDSTLDPQGAGQAFKVLKQLVSNWLADATQNNNRQAALCCCSSCFAIDAGVRLASDAHAHVRARHVRVMQQKHCIQVARSTGTGFAAGVWLTQCVPWSHTHTHTYCIKLA